MVRTTKALAASHFRQPGAASSSTLSMSSPPGQPPDHRPAHTQTNRQNRHQQEGSKEAPGGQVVIAVGPRQNWQQEMTNDQ